VGQKDKKVETRPKREGSEDRTRMAEERGGEEGWSHAVQLFQL
jgi:hypothetical protein